MSGKPRVKSETSAEGAALTDMLALALALEIRTMIDKRGGQISLGRQSDNRILEKKR